MKSLLSVKAEKFVYILFMTWENGLRKKQVLISPIDAAAQQKKVAKIIIEN